MNRGLVATAGGAVLLALAAYWYWPAAGAPAASQPPRVGEAAGTPPDPGQGDELVAPDPPGSAAPIAYARNPLVFDRSAPLKQRLAEWSALARTDPGLAYDLGLGISSCAGVRQDLARVERMVKAGGMAVRAAENALDQQVYCEGLTKQDFDTGIDLLDRAASSGLVKAQEDYVFSAGAVIASVDGYEFDADRITRFKRDAVNHLHRAAATGSATALARLSEIHEQGTVVPANPALAARYFREYVERSGNNSKHTHARLAELEARAAGQR